VGRCAVVVGARLQGQVGAGLEASASALEQLAAPRAWLRRRLPLPQEPAPPIGRRSGMPPAGALPRQARGCRLRRRCPTPAHRLNASPQAVTAPLDCFQLRILRAAFPTVPLRCAPFGVTPHPQGDEFPRRGGDVVRGERGEGARTFVNRHLAPRPATACRRVLGRVAGGLDGGLASRCAWPLPLPLPVLAVLIVSP